jgi:hypothetical protein
MVLLLSFPSTSFLAPSSRSFIDLWLSQTPDARKTHYSLSLFNLTQARAADDELWCVYGPVFDFLAMRTSGLQSSSGLEKTEIWRVRTVSVTFS